MYSRRITYLDAPLLKSLGIGGCRDGRHRASAKRQFDNLSRTPRGHYAISAAIGRANDVIEEGRPMSVNGTFRTSRDVRLESANGCKAEVGISGQPGPLMTLAA